MIRIEKYKEEFLPQVISIFRSNIPNYFLDHEEAELVADIPDFMDSYFVMFLNDEMIGAGGYALNVDNTVSLCWGMVHKVRRGKGFGKALLEFRLNEIKKYYPGKTIVNTTSQHNLGFFEKYGFKMTHFQENGIGPGLSTCKMELKTN